jgi:hypothetical protein
MATTSIPLPKLPNLPQLYAEVENGKVQRVVAPVGGYVIKELVYLRRQDGAWEEVVHNSLFPMREEVFKQLKALETS